jgi:23S rRNA pseudouridine955/2504/2580 synthase
MITITPTANDVGQRIDNFIKKTYPKLKLFQIQKYIRIKRLKVNEKKVNNDYRLQANDKIQLYINDNLLEKERSVKDYLLAPTTLDVVFEDKNILIINKPVGLVVHDDETKTTDTLSNRVMHYLFNKKE